MFSKNTWNTERRYAGVQFLVQLRIWRRKSRDAYACRFTFGLPEFLLEINDHVNLAFGLFENPLLAQFEQMKVDQKRNFEQFEGDPKAKFTWSFISKRNSDELKVKRNEYASRHYLLQILNWIKNWTPV